MRVCPFGFLSKFSSDQTNRLWVQFLFIQRGVHTKNAHRTSKYPSSETHSVPVEGDCEYKYVLLCMIFLSSDIPQSDNNLQN